MCSDSYLPREPGDMADLETLCRKCAEECAAQLSHDYNLPLGCSDEERQAALEDPPPGSTVRVIYCFTVHCTRYRNAWKTTLSPQQWFEKYGKFYHCFSCGHYGSIQDQYTVVEAT
jgi:hypothetical protein